MKNEDDHVMTVCIRYVIQPLHELKADVGCRGRGVYGKLLYCLDWVTGGVYELYSMFRVMVLMHVLVQRLGESSNNLVDYM